MHRGRADRDQARDVVHIHRVTRDRDDVGGHAPARLQQVRMHGPDRERHRHWQPVLRRAPVAQGDHAPRRRRFPTKALQSVAQRFVRRVGGVEHHRVLEDPGQLGGAKHRGVELEQLVLWSALRGPAVFSGHGRVVPSQQRAVGAAFRLEREETGAEQNAQRHHRLLTQRVDRGVGHLREPLPQVAVDAPRRASQRGDRDVVPHRVHRLRSRLCHGVDHELDVLEAPAMEGVLRREIVQRLEVDVMPLDGYQHPVSQERVVVACRGTFLGVRVAEQRSIAGVDEQHLTWTEPAPLDDIRGRHRHHARLRRRGHETVFGALPSERPQPVAVERRADDGAVAEGQRGRAVPGLEPDRLVAIEIAHRGGQVASTLPRVGHEAHQRFADLPPALHEQLERVVE